MSDLLITCPDNCLPGTVPTFTFEDCASTTIPAQITDIFFTAGAGLADSQSAVEWANRIDNQDQADADSIRHLFVIGSLPKPTFTKKSTSHNRTEIGIKTRTLPFKVDDMSLENINSFRQLECGGTFRCWFVIGGKYLVGGNSGFQASYNGDPTATDNLEDFLIQECELEWKAETFPTVELNIIAGSFGV